MKSDIFNVEKDYLSRIMNFCSKKVLEIGCGYGIRLEYLSPNSLEYHAIDQNDKAINYLKEKYQYKPNIFPRVCRAEVLDFVDDYFDNIVMIMSFHEFPIQVQYKALCEALRVLKIKGQLIIIDPNYPSSIFQKCFDLIHQEFFVFDHGFAVKNARKVISKVIERYSLSDHSESHYEISYLFENVEDLHKYVISEFRDEITWDKNQLLRLSAILNTYCLKNHLSMEKPILLTDDVAVFELIK